MTSLQNKHILKDMKEEVIELYMNLGYCLQKRDVINTKIYERKIKDMEKVSEDRLLRLYDCKCDSEDDSDDEYQKFLLGNPKKCISCLRDFVERVKAEHPPLLDKLNWGLTGLLEEPSGESSGITSSDDEQPKTSSYAREKTLRKLRREGPKKFELKYSISGVETFLKMEINEDELREMLKSESSKDVLIKRKQFKKHVLPLAESIDKFAGGHYTFTNNSKLTPTFSETGFDYTACVIKELQKYLNKHSDELYPNLSEIMASSAFCSDREVLAHYYHVLKMKRVKNCEVTVEEMKDVSINENIQEDTLPPDEILRAKKTGVLIMSGRSLKDVPVIVWQLDKTSIEHKATDKNKSNVKIESTEIKKSEPLKCLDLSDNSLIEVKPEGESLSSLHALKLNRNKIFRLPSAFKRFTCLTDLSLSNNKIVKLPKALGRITTLKHLNASLNDLESVPDELGNLFGLLTLDLRWNKLKHIPESFSQLQNLKVMNAGYNRLHRIPTNIKNMVSLVVLDVSYNKLPKFPSLCGLNHLMVLNASGNYIKQFPQLSDCKRLCEVRLDGNRMKSLKIDFIKNVPVVQLTLSYNKILRIPDDCYRMRTLVLLDMTANRLDWIPWSLARLKYLSCIKVELNPIKNVRTEDIKEGSKRIMEVLLQNMLYYESDEDASARTKHDTEETNFDADETADIYSKENDDKFNLNKNLLGETAVPVKWLEEFAKCKVSSLDLSRNKLGWLPYHVTMLAPSLQRLYVRDNCFKVMPRFINELTNLTEMDLSGNHLSAFPSTLSQCPLVKLVCVYNEFLCIPKVLFRIKTLTYLDFSFNNLNAIDVDGLKMLKDLTHLNLHSNEIDYVPSALGFHSSIKELDIGDNKFKYPEKSVLDKGTDEVMAYLRKHDEKEVLYMYANDKQVPKRAKKRVTIPNNKILYDKTLNNAT